MTARERESAQDYVQLLRKLLATKLTASTALALLAESANQIDTLIKALGDQEAELARALHLVDCECCDVSYPRGDLVDGLCPTCVRNRCGQVRSRIAAEFIPGRVIEEVAAELASVIPPAAIPPLPPPCDSVGPAGLKCTAFDHRPLGHAAYDDDGDLADHWPLTPPSVPDDLVSDGIVGDLVVRVADDSPVPLTGRVISLGEFAGTVMVAWGDQRDATIPRTVTEAYDGLVPAPGKPGRERLHMVPGGAS